MRSLVYLGPGAVALEERPDPMPVASDDVLVRVTGSGICGTDRQILLGRFPARPGVVLGHESVGVVVGRGAAVRSVDDGDRVVVNPTLYCGACNRCQRGATNFCVNKAGTEVGVDRDGTFADYVVLPERFVHRLPGPIDFRQAVLIEPLACVLNNITAAAVSYHDVVVVLGAGPIGMLCGVLSERQARRLTVVETDPYRVDKARTRFAHVVDGAATPLSVAVPEQPSVVIDTTGTRLADALALVADGGRVVAMGFNDSYRATLSPLYLTSHGISVIGAGDYPAEVFPRAVDLISELAITDLVTHEYPLEQYREAFEALNGVPASDAVASHYTAMKVVIRSDRGELGTDGWPAAVATG